MNQAKPTLMKENILIAVMCLLYPVIPVQGQQRDSTMQTRQFKTHYSREIYGMVVDDTGEPLTGATITSVGEDGNRATTMAVTDVNGHFMMSLGEDTRALEVSFIGFKPRRIALTRESSYKIELQPDSKSVGEVVVNGAFTRKANTFTGAVTTVSGDDLSRVGNQNVLQSLKNIDPSFMQIENLGAGSNPNALPDFQMRGTSTISSVQGEYASNANQPLFILDGFETSSPRFLTWTWIRCRVSPR